MNKTPPSPLDPRTNIYLRAWGTLVSGLSPQMWSVGTAGLHIVLLGPREEHLFLHLSSVIKRNKYLDAASLAYSTTFCLWELSVHAHPGEISSASTGSISQPCTMQTSPKGLHLEPESYFRGSDEGFQPVHPTNVEHLPMEVFSQSPHITTHFGDEAIVNRSCNPQLCWDRKRFDALLRSNQASPWPLHLPSLYCPSRPGIMESCLAGSSLANLLWQNLQI